MGAVVLLVWGAHGGVTESEAEGTCQTIAELLRRSRAPGGSPRVAEAVVVGGAGQEALGAILEGKDPDVVIFTSGGLLDMANQTRAERPGTRVVVLSAVPSDLSPDPGVRVLLKGAGKDSKTMVRRMLYT